MKRQGCLLTFTFSVTKNRHWEYFNIFGVKTENHLNKIGMILQLCVVEKPQLFELLH